MEKETQNQDKFMSSVKVGPKGQIVIPKQIRDMFAIEPGDTLIIMADVQKGIALERMAVFNRIADAILSGHGDEIYPESDPQDNLKFAQEIKKVNKKNEEEE
jgi:AbrB family looped-hinge helix DNA binding protein